MDRIQKAKAVLAALNPSMGCAMCKSGTVYRYFTVTMPDKTKRWVCGGCWRSRFPMSRHFYSDSEAHAKLVEWCQKNEQI